MVRLGWSGEPGLGGAAELEGGRGWTVQLGRESASGGRGTGWGGATRCRRSQSVFGTQGGVWPQDQTGISAASTGGGLGPE